MPEHSGPANVLVNLCAEPPSFFSRFERLVEVVGTRRCRGPAGRVRFKFYRERGYELRAHDVRGWS